MKTVAIEHQSIINISTGIGDYGSLEYKQTVFYPLAQFFTSKATATEREHFLRETLPAIIDLALKVESLLPTEGIAVSEQQNGKTLQSPNNFRNLTCPAAVFHSSYR